MRISGLLLALGLVAAPLTTGCTSRQRIHLETSLAEALVSPRQEAEIGRQIQQELDTKVRFVDDPVVTEHMAHIGERVFAGVRDRSIRRTLDLRVIDEPKVVNAFATPGGHIYVYSGLLLFAEDEAEVAGVIAHETGHVVRRHAARQLLYLFGYSALARLALGDNPSTLARIGTTIVGNGFFMAHGRSEEHEADRVGLGLLARSGYDPRGMPRFFRRLLQVQGQPPALLVWLSSHPTTSSRIAEITDIIRRRRLAGGETGFEEQAELRERLQRLSHVRRPVSMREPANAR
jgi:predicted Zn-dependent protease